MNLGMPAPTQSASIRPDPYPHHAVIQPLAFWAVVWGLILCWAFTKPAHAGNVELTQAAVVISDAASFPSNAEAEKITLPDDWSVNRPGYSGSVWYRLQFDRPPDVSAGEPLVIHIVRVCSNLEVALNGQPLFNGGRMEEPVTRNCDSSPLMVLPPSVLKPEHNTLDIKVRGSSLESVASRQRAAGLSIVHLGTPDNLVRAHQVQRFWGPTWARASCATLAVLGLLMIALSMLGRREAPLMYFGLLTLSWSLMAAGLAWHNPPLESSRYELLLAASFPVLGAFAVQFLLSHAGVRSRLFESLLVLQCLVVPVTLTLAGMGHLFDVARAWYTLIGLELLAAMGLYLWLAFQSRRTDFQPMALLLPFGALLVIVELKNQYSGGLIEPSSMAFDLAPTILLALGFLTLLLDLTRALRAAELARLEVETRALETAAEMEYNFAQMADERVQQVTEAERKRIASDLHDDLGAKLLTIVHTSQNERISSLAREALEEMRLSVRGLTGRPMRLLDALGDWRAEIVMRLGQAGIEADWKTPVSETEQALTARVYVQSTRVLRESVSNIIKHSGASLCTVSCTFDEHEFSITVQDNGRGIPPSSDSKLDRGHGMASMKHRAKQLNGQCLVESAPGFGTVIRLTIPFESSVQTV